MAAPDTLRAADLSPVSLSYVAALRGVKPRLPGIAFAYASLNPRDPHALICLAASNPEGRFFGILPGADAVKDANNLAAARHAGNILFLADSPESLPLRQDLPALDYLVWDERDRPLIPAEREALFAFAEKAVKPSGLLTGLYRAYANPDDILRFLVNEFAPAMDAEQARTFLQEIKALGPLYFSGHSIPRSAIERALDSGKPEDFFTACGLGEKTGSGTLDVMAGLLPRRFSFAGDADVRANYMELTTPAEAHEALEQRAGDLLYEAVKDFAMNRLVRHDVWVRLPAEQTSDPAVLFGSFTYGIMLPPEEVPAVVNAVGKAIDLSQPLMAKMIALMTSLPMTIGDFLQHPLGQGINPGEVVEAMQILVATGLAQPMRGHHESQGDIQLSQLKWATAFNRYLNATPIASARVLLASQVIGSGVNVPARDALVMQAINRAGFADFAGALLLELERLARDPALAAMIMDVVEPTEALAEHMTQDVIRRSMIQWYAYGLLAA